ncbi:MAG: family 1 glycosylhydrolase [Acidimicrobiales bacterium]
MAWPEGFWWGTAASALQCEGAASASDWATWEAEGWVPRSRDGNGFLSRYEDDLRLVADHGFTHHRLTIEWARVEPDDGRHDNDAVVHYRDVLRSGRDAGLAMWVCLHHLTLPRWFTDDLRGFRDDKAGRYRWSAHVDFCAEAFGDLVAGWQPMEAPARYALEGFLFGRIPPGRHDAREFPAVLGTVQKANADAARLLRGGDVPVATSHWLAPLRPTHDRADTVLWDSWADPELVEPFDVLGITVNTAVTVEDSTDESGPRFILIGDPEPSPEAMEEAAGEVIGRVAEQHPDRPIVVRGSELAVDDDDRRVANVRAILGALDDAIEAGADVRGYLHWTAVDGYELDGGFETTRGLWDRDRNPRASADVLPPS